MHTPVSLASARSWLKPLPRLLRASRRTIEDAWKWLTWPGPIFHITHHKAGSQWVRAVLEDLVKPAIVYPEHDGSQLLSRPVNPKGVYPTLYITRQQFESVELPRRWKRFVVIRDLRDTLVSLYFSLKVSHSLMTDSMESCRARLQTMTTEQALVCLTRTVCDPIAALQRSWLGGPDHVLKYEDFLEHDAELFERVLIGHCRLPVAREQLRAVVATHRFEARSGRKRGQEDQASHERKGIAGDWRNYFTDRVAKEFKGRFGELLVETGYEKDDRW
jgi:lipopolysaccharide transport system ATP-binding protein